jgi:hypothetical protein
MLGFIAAFDFAVAGLNAWVFSEYHNPVNLMAACALVALGLFCLVVAAR